MAPAVRGLKSFVWQSKWLWGSFPSPAARAPGGRSVGAGRPGASAAEAPAPRSSVCGVGGARRGEVRGRSRRGRSRAACRSWGGRAGLGSGPGPMALWAAGGWRLLPAVPGVTRRPGGRWLPRLAAVPGVRSDGAAKRRLCLFRDKGELCRLQPAWRPLKSLNPSQLFKQFSVTSELLLLGSAPTPEGALLSLFVFGFTVFGRKSWRCSLVGLQVNCRFLSPYFGAGSAGVCYRKWSCNCSFLCRSRKTDGNAGSVSSLGKRQRQPPHPELNCTEVVTPWAAQPARRLSLKWEGPAAVLFTFFSFASTWRLFVCVTRSEKQTVLLEFSPNCWYLYSACMNLIPLFKT